MGFRNELFLTFKFVFRFVFRVSHLEQLSKCERDSRVLKTRKSKKEAKENKSKQAYIA